MYRGREAAKGRPEWWWTDSIKHVLIDEGLSGEVALDWAA